MNTRFLYKVGDRVFFVIKYRKQIKFSDYEIKNIKSRFDP